MAAPHSYGWISESALGDAACVTVIVGSPANEVLARFGADSSRTMAAADGDAPGGSVAVVGVPGGVLAVEFNGFQGSLGEVIQRLSTDGLAASMFWNVNDDNAFSCARDGQLIASVDMYDAEDGDEIDLPEELRDLFELAADEDADLHAVGVAMVERFTGVAVPEDAIASITVAHPVPNA